jgi:hypothetical protein
MCRPKGRLYENHPRAPGLGVAALSGSCPRVRYSQPSKGDVQVPMLVSGMRSPCGPALKESSVGGGEAPK